MDAATIATAASSQPQTGPRFWRLNGINLFWFASQGLWNATYVLLAVAASLIAPRSKELVVGQATALGGVLAVVVPVAVGWLSDRTSSRFGRRTPWIVGGTVLNLAGFGLLIWSGSVPALLFAYVVFQLGNNASEAAFAAVIPDVVPQEARGGASGLLNTASILGTVTCLALTVVLLKVFGSTSTGVNAAWAAIAVLLAACLAVSMVLLREPPHRSLRRPRSAPGPAAVLAGLAALLKPLRDRDFRWVLLTRILQTLGIWTILPFVAFYFQDVVKADNYGATSSLWLLCVLAGGILPALACGILSDRWGRRKLFVYVSSGLQAAVSCVLLLTLVRDVWVLYALGVLFGVGFGAYSAVDWALACDVLPDREHSAAGGMALFHVAYTLPQVFAPALLAAALSNLNRGGSMFLGMPTGGNLGFRVVFASASLWFLASTIMVRQIRGVR